jgi:membrane-anchored protein YejM (alkaline phosphatase superfamily)
MRWVFLVAKSLATGVLAIVLSLIVLLVTSSLYDKYVLHLGPNEAMGWDPVSLFGQHWKLVLIGIPVLIFLLGCMAGFWFFDRSVTSR